MAEIGAIRAGKAFVEAFLDDTKLKKGLKGVRAQLAAFGAGISSLGTKFSIAGAAIITPLVAAAHHFMSFGSELKHMSERTGIGTNALSEFGYAAQLSGSNMEELEIAIKRMQKAITAATEGPLKKLQGMSPEEQFMAMAEAISAIPDPTERAAKALEVFGRGGTRMIPMMKDLLALCAEAVASGRSIDPKTAEDAEKLNKAWLRLTMQFKGAAIAVGSSLAPAFTSLAGKMKEMLGAATQWLAVHPKLVNSTLAFGVALGALGIALKVVGVSLTLLAAHPLVVGFMALGVAIIALKGGFSGLFKEMEQYDDAAEKGLERGDRQRAAMRGVMDELQALAAEQQLGMADQERAKELIAELTKVYGDLGFGIEGATGAIVGMDRAQKMLNATQKETAKRELEAAIASLDQEKNRRLQRVEDIRTDTPNWKWAFGNPLGEIHEESEKAIQAAEKAQALRNRLRDLLRGNLGALLPGAAATTPSAAALPADDKLATRLAHEQNQRVLDGIDDAEKRAIAATHQKWNAELQGAQRTKEEKSRIAAEEAAEIASIQGRFSKERAKEEAANRERLADEIARTQIDATMKGSAKEFALLELERQKMLREAEAQGLSRADVNRLFDLRKAGIDLETPRTSVVGTFSASALRGMGTGGVVKKLDEIKELTRKQLIEFIRFNLAATP